MNIQNVSHDAGFAKDAVYSFLNSSHINWSNFLLNTAICVLCGKICNMTSEKRIYAIVVDDTMYERSSSKKVEILANVFHDSSKGAKFKKGFRMLILACTF